MNLKIITVSEGERNHTKRIHIVWLHTQTHTHTIKHSLHTHMHRILKCGTVSFMCHLKSSPCKTLLWKIFLRSNSKSEFRLGPAVVMATPVCPGPKDRHQHCMCVFLAFPPRLVPLGPLSGNNKALARSTRYLWSGCGPVESEAMNRRQGVGCVGPGLWPLPPAGLPERLFS